LPWEDIVKVVRQTAFSLKRGGVAEKEGFWPMRESLGERFGVVFSFPVVVTDTELVECSGFMLFLVLFSSFSLRPSWNVDLDDFLIFPGRGCTLVNALDNGLWLHDIVDGW
jgi:hypothetical protein